MLMRWSIKNQYSHDVDIPHAIDTSIEGTGVMDIHRLCAFTSFGGTLQDLRQDEEDYGHDSNDCREDHEEMEAINQTLKRKRHKI